MQSKKNFLPQDCGKFLMRHIWGVSIIALILLSACSISRDATHYSKADLTENAIIALYNDVPMVKGEAANLFIRDLKLPDWDLARQAGFNGEVIISVLVDENANVEAAFINQSAGDLLDEAVVEAVKGSKFKAFDELMGKASKYTLVVSYRTNYGKIQMLPLNYQPYANLINEARNGR